MVSLYLLFRSRSKAFPINALPSQSANRVELAVVTLLSGLTLYAHAILEQLCHSGRHRDLQQSGVHVEIPQYYCGPTAPAPLYNTNAQPASAAVLGSSNPSPVWMLVVWSYLRLLSQGEPVHQVPYGSQDTVEGTSSVECLARSSPTEQRAKSVRTHVQVFLLSLLAGRIAYQPSCNSTPILLSLTRFVGRGTRACNEEENGTRKNLGLRM